MAAWKAEIGGARKSAVEGRLDHLATGLKSSLGARSRLVVLEIGGHDGLEEEWHLSS